MIQGIIFVAASILLLIVSRASLRRPGSHGFFRTFAWECILALILINATSWFARPLSLPQLLSWFLLLLSLGSVVAGAIALKLLGRPGPERAEAGLIGMEKTTRLVTRGPYGYIRHPFYGSLLFLAWGAFLKHVSWAGLGLAGAASVFVVVTALREETENIAFFGDEYRAYMRRTRRFVPFVF